jgi:hypothetical protein
MGKRNKYHVTYKDGNWKVKKEGRTRALKIFERKQDAVNYGRVQAKKGGMGQLKIHKKDGKIQEERTYGKDPFPPKG